MHPDVGLGRSNACARVFDTDIARLLPLPRFTFQFDLFTLDNVGKRTFMLVAGQQL
jgi:hypothetical protein